MTSKRQDSPTISRQASQNRRVHAMRLDELKAIFLDDCRLLSQGGRAAPTEIPARLAALERVAIVIKYFVFLLDELLRLLGVGLDKDLERQGPAGGVLAVKAVQEAVRDLGLATTPVRRGEELDERARKSRVRQLLHGVDLCTGVIRSHVPHQLGLVDVVRVFVGEAGKGRRPQVSKHWRTRLPGGDSGNPPCVCG